MVFSTSVPSRRARFAARTRRAWAMAASRRSHRAAPPGRCPPGLSSWRRVQVARPDEGRVLLRRLVPGPPRRGRRRPVPGGRGGRLGSRGFGSRACVVLRRGKAAELRPEGTRHRESHDRERRGPAEAVVRREADPRPRSTRCRWRRRGSRRDRPGAHRRARDLGEVGPTAAAVHVEPGAAVSRSGPRGPGIARA